MHPVLAALRASVIANSEAGPYTRFVEIIDKAQDILDNGLGANTNFESFWKLYPRKVGKPAACRAWLKMEGDKYWDAIRANIVMRLSTEQWERTPDRIQYIPHPTTYLNQRRWLDEGVPVDGKWNDV